MYLLRVFCFHRETTRESWANHEREGSGGGCPGDQGRRAVGGEILHLDGSGVDRAGGGRGHRHSRRAAGARAGGAQDGRHLDRRARRRPGRLPAGGERSAADARRRAQVNDRAPRVCIAGPAAASARAYSRIRRP